MFIRLMRFRSRCATRPLGLYPGIIGLALCLITAAHAQSGDNIGAKLGGIVPGRATKADVTSAFGAPSRIVQFNDCGMAMDDQADEIWEYRGTDAQGSYRIHVEFGDDGMVHLVAKIPDQNPGGKAVTARAVAAGPMKGMSM